MGNDQEQKSAPPPSTPAALSTNLTTAIASVLGVAMYRVAPPAATWNLQPGVPVAIPIDPLALAKLLTVTFVTVARIQGVSEADLHGALSHALLELSTVPTDELRRVLHAAMGITVQAGMTELAAREVGAAIETAMAEARHESNPEGSN